MEKIRVILVDDHTILREGLRALLGYYEDIQVVGEAENGLEAIARVEELHPDVVLMDIAMPEMNGLEATRIISRRFPQTRVLVLTQYEDREYVLSLMQAGGAGYVLKDTVGTDLVAAIRALHRGETFLQPAVTGAVVEEVRRKSAEPGTPAEPLTVREREILQLVAEDKSNSQIAAKLGLSVRTVKWHRVNLMSKLGIHTVTGLVRYAIEHGLVRLSE